MASTSTLRSGGFSVDTREFAAFASALRRAQPELLKSTKTKLKGAGELVADEARKLASFSKKIPPTIKVRVTGTLGVAVVASGVLAGLEELGNSGSRGGGTFRHPVFGTDAWVDQKMHPFLLPALKSKTEAAVELILTAVDEAIVIAIT